MAAGVDAPRLLKELSALWEETGKQDPAGVLRACAMTLVVAVDERCDAGVVGQALAELMREHPSRAIVVRVSASRAGALESRVAMACWTPFGRRRQICSEQIEILAGAGRLAELPPAIRGLVAPDLPVVLVGASSELFFAGALDPLLPLAGKVIVDSAAAAGPDGALAAIRAAAAHRLVADLAWGRLTPWREPLAQVWEQPGQAEVLAAVERIRVVHSPGPAPLEARYLAAWLARGAPRARLEFSPAGTATITRVEMRGPRGGLTLSRGADSVVELRLDAVVRHYVLPAASLWALVRGELGIPGRDPHFEEALARAGDLMEAIR